MQAHREQADAWQTLAGDILYTAGSAGGARLMSSLQDGGFADLPEYDADAEGEREDGLTAFVAAHQADFVSGVQRHTSDMLAAALTTAALALSDGEDGTGTGAGAVSASTATQAMEDATNDLYDQWTGQRADTQGDYAGQIAADWTAVGWAHGEWDALTQLVDTGSGGEYGVERTWTTVGDSHVRPAHEDADGQTVGLHETFEVGGEQLLYPGSPEGSLGNTLGCRCSIAYDVSYGSPVDVSAVPSDEADLEAASEGDTGGVEYASLPPGRLARKRRRSDYRRFMEAVL